MLIPPSIVLIIYGIVVEQSIGRLFLRRASCRDSSIKLFFIFIMHAWRKINPAIAPGSTKAPLIERLRALPNLYGSPLSSSS